MHSLPAIQSKYQIHIPLGAKVNVFMTCELAITCCSWMLWTASWEAVLLLIRVIGSPSTCFWVVLCLRTRSSTEQISESHTAQPWLTGGEIAVGVCKRTETMATYHTHKGPRTVPGPLCTRRQTPGTQAEWNLWAGNIRWLESDQTEIPMQWEPSRPKLAS